MIDVYEFKITKAELAAMPEKDRHALILCGHAMNQINTLMKIVTVLNNHDGETGVEEKVSAAQTLVMLRYLFGTLAETWKMVTDRIKSTKEGKGHLEKMGDTGRDALTRLNRQFGGPSLLHKIRNSIAFHYSNDAELKANFEATPEDDDMWSWYLSATNANSFYYLNEVIVIHGLLEVTGKADLSEAFSEVMAVAMETTNDLSDFLQSYLRVLVLVHFPQILNQKNVVLTVDSPPNLKKFKVPFYFEPAPISSSVS